MDKSQLNHVLLKIWNEKQDEDIFHLFAQECIIHSSIGSFQSAKEMHSMVKIWMKAFPDLKVNHLNIFQEGEVFIVQWESRATHQGEFEGIAPTGKSVHYKGCSFYKFSGQQVVEYWAYVDRFHLEKQLVS